MKELESTVQVIATAVEKDTNSLRQLLIRNGVKAGMASKDQLQSMVTSALSSSATFREEFRNWVLERSGVKSYANATGDFAANPFISMFGPAGAAASATATAATSAPVTAATNDKPATGAGFFSGVTLNSLLDFAKDGLNNYTTIVQSKNDKAIVDAAVEKERLNIGTGETTITSNSTGKWVYVLVGIVAIGAIGGAIYYYSKKK